MTCLTDAALTALALGGAAPDTLAHLADCPACADRVARVRAALDHFEAAHTAPDPGHAAGRARLLQALATEPVPHCPTFLRRVLMDRRTWAATAAAATTLAAAVILGLGGTPSVALADGLKPFREAKSFTCVLISLDGGKPVENKGPKSTQTLTWAAPGSLRSDIQLDGKPYRTDVLPHQKPGVSFEHSPKTFRATDAKPGRQESMVLRLIAELATYSAADQKPAGADDINGVKAQRFDLSVPVPELKDATWRYRVWIDPAAKRPVRVDYALQANRDPAAAGVIGLRLETFEWDVKTDGLFDTTPPAGYIAAPKK